MPNELERIRKNQFKNNRSYLCSFFVFISTLLLTTSLNEFTLLASPLCFLTKNHKDDLMISEKDVIIIIMILHILSFPFIIFIRMMKTFNVERRLLLAFYVILSCLMIAFFSSSSRFICSWRSPISSRSTCSCCSRKMEITLPGSSSSSSFPMVSRDSPVSRRKQMIFILFRSSSEYSLRPPSVNALGIRIPF